MRSSESGDSALNIIYMASLTKSEFLKAVYLLKELDLLTKAMQVEIISDVFLVDLDKEFMTFKVAEPRNPAFTAFGLVFII